MQFSSDTNIWIDFSEIESLHLPFLLNSEFYMCEEAVHDEILAPPELSEQLLRLGLQTVTVSDNELMPAVEIGERHRRLSRYDALALATAIKRNFTLLTGDKQLRKAAETMGTPYHGTLWIFDQLIDQKVLTEIEYVRLLQILLQKNGGVIRLPEAEIRKRIKNHL